MKADELTKYEKARILGARALQIAMNAPLLIKISQEDLEKIKFDALKIAEIELESDILPISIKKPFPKRKEDVLKRTKEQVVSDEQKAEIEAKLIGELTSHTHAGGSGDMTKAIYDSNADGVIEAAQLNLSSKANATHSHATTDITGTAVITTDSRLSDARTPTTHSHPPSEVTGTAVITSDSRLSDARTPTAHNQSATTITTDTLDGDRLRAISTTKKGGVPLTGTPSGKFLKDDNTWATPAGGGGGMNLLKTTSNQWSYIAVNLLAFSELSSRAVILSAPKIVNAKLEIETFEAILPPYQ